MRFRCYEWDLSEAVSGLHDKWFIRRNTQGECCLHLSIRLYSWCPHVNLYYKSNDMQREKIGSKEPKKVRRIIMHILGVRAGIKYENQAKHYILAQFRAVRCVPESSPRSGSFSGLHPSQPSCSCLSSISLTKVFSYSLLIFIWAWMRVLMHSVPLSRVVLQYRHKNTY